jgi:hypothetical protein
MPPQPVPGFVTAGDAANAALETLALRLALRLAVNVLKRTDENITVMLEEGPSVTLGKWREEVRKALQVAEHAGEAA